MTCSSLWNFRTNLILSVVIFTAFKNLRATLKNEYCEILNSQTTYCKSTLEYDMTVYSCKRYTVAGYNIVNQQKNAW